MNPRGNAGGWKGLVKGEPTTLASLWRTHQRRLIVIGLLCMMIFALAYNFEFFLRHAPPTPPSASTSVSSSPSDSTAHPPPPPPPPPPPSPPEHQSPTPPSSQTRSTPAVLSQEVVEKLKKEHHVDFSSKDLIPVPWREKPLILYNPRVSTFLGGHMLNPVASCEKACEFTEDLSKTSQALGVIFHVPTSAPPPPKVYRQVFATLSMESVVIYPNMDAYRKRVDWEMSYRLSAEIWTPYFGLNTDFRQPAEPKTASAPIAAFISNCASRNSREKYFTELSKHIRIDSYGKCFHNMGAGFVKDKVDTIKTYKFSLAWENSNSPDYVSEKVYHALRAGSVPIYMGAPNIAELVPPNSIINVADFKSPKDLADYLQELLNNEAKYNKYLEWKTLPDWGVFEEHRQRTGMDARCSVCIKLHQISNLIFDPIPS